MIEALEFLWKGQGLKVLEDDGKTYRKPRPFNEPENEEDEDDDEEEDDDDEENEDDGEVETWMQRLERESFGWAPPPGFTLRTSMDLMAVIEAVAAPNQPKSNAGPSAARTGNAATATKNGVASPPPGAAGASPSTRSTPMARLAPYDLVTCAYVLGDLTAQMSGPASKGAAASAAAASVASIASTSDGSRSSSSSDDVTQAFKTDVARADAVNAARAEREKVHAADTAAQQSVAAAAAVALWGCVAPGGLLVLVEPGDKAGAMRLQAARQALLKAYAAPPPSQSSGAASGAAAHQAKRASKTPTATIVAPCTHHLMCPFDPNAPKSALESLAISAGVGKSGGHLGRINSTAGRRSGTRQGRPGDSRNRSNNSSGRGDEFSGSSSDAMSASAGGWCRFVQRVPRERLKGGPNADERFSYLVVHKSDPRNSNGSSNGSRNHSRSNDNAPHDSNENDDCQATSPAEVAIESGGRLLRTPLKRTGHVVLDVCRPATKAGMGTPGAKAARAAARRQNANSRRAAATTGGDAAGAATGDSLVQSSPPPPVVEEETFAAIERRIVSRAKHPALFAAARKATWGGTWPADEALLWRSEKPASEESAEEMFTKYFGPKGLGLPPDEVKKRVAVALQFQQEQMEAAESLAAIEGVYAMDEVEDREGRDRDGDEEVSSKRRRNRRGRQKQSLGSENDDNGDSGLSEINAFLSRVQKSQPSALDGFQGDKDIESTFGADFVPRGEEQPPKNKDEGSYTVDLLQLNKRNNAQKKEPKKSQAEGEKQEGGRKRRPRFMSKRFEK